MHNNKQTQRIKHFSDYVSSREPSLNVGMTALPLVNPTIKSIQLGESIDLLAETEQLTVANRNKNLNVPNIDAISSNKIDEQYEQVQGIAVPYTPYNEYE